MPIKKAKGRQNTSIAMSSNKEANARMHAGLKVFFTLAVSIRKSLFLDERLVTEIRIAVFMKTESDVDKESIGIVDELVEADMPIS